MWDSIYIYTWIEATIRGGWLDGGGWTEVEAFHGGSCWPLVIASFLEATRIDCKEAFGSGAGTTGERSETGGGDCFGELAVVDWGVGCLLET